MFKGNEDLGLISLLNCFDIHFEGNSYSRNVFNGIVKVQTAEKLYFMDEYIEGNSGLPLFTLESIGVAFLWNVTFTKSN